MPGGAPIVNVIVVIVVIVLNIIRGSRNAFKDREVLLTSGSHLDITGLPTWIWAVRFLFLIKLKEIKEQYTGGRSIAFILLCKNIILLKKTDVLPPSRHLTTDGSFSFYHAFRNFPVNYPKADS